MDKLNCWEFKNCGREPGGKNVNMLGVCPAAVEGRLDKVYSGKNAGRTCWVVAGTLCGGTIQGTYATKLSNCMQCDFYKSVRQSGDSNITSKELLAKLS